MCKQHLQTLQSEHDSRTQTLLLCNQALGKTHLCSYRSAFLEHLVINSPSWSTFLKRTVLDRMQCAMRPACQECAGMVAQRAQLGIYALLCLKPRRPVESKPQRLCAPVICEALHTAIGDRPQCALCYHCTNGKEGSACHWQSCVTLRGPLNVNCCCVAVRGQQGSVHALQQGAAVRSRALPCITPCSCCSCHYLTKA